MNITIYQMILEPKNHDLIFQDLKSIYAACQNRVPAEIYEPVYHGEIRAKALEDIFYIFNVRHPEDYCGRSLSVSDVVEVHGPEESSSFYFCDRFGFEKIDFDRDKAVRRNHQDDRKE